MGEVTISQLLGLTLGSSWGQVLLWVAVVGSVAWDKRESLQAIPAKLSAWWTARRAGKTATETPTQRTACENRRTDKRRGDGTAAPGSDDRTGKRCDGQCRDPLSFVAAGSVLRTGSLSEDPVARAACRKNKRRVRYPRARPLTM